MKQDKSILGTLLAAVIIMLMLAACAKPYHFYVKYDSPGSSSVLKGQKVYLQVLDGRESKIFLSEKASSEFDMWDGSFALYDTPEKPKCEIQTYPLTGLVESAMLKRLQSMGIELV